MDQEGQKPQHHIPWIAIALALLALVTFVFSSSGQQVIPPMMGGGYSVESSAPMMPKGIQVSGSNAADRAMMPPNPYPYNGGTSPITDTREFNKTYYSATMRTRDVPGLTRRAETTVHGYGGRIDQESTSEKYGYISFVVPASKFEQFRTEIESFVGSRFLKVNISSENLLPQKQGIEQTQKGVEKSLADAKDARKKAVSAHGSVAASLNDQIDANASALVALRASGKNDSFTLTQISNLENAQASLRAHLSNENAAYNNKIASYDQQIKYWNDSLAGVQKQDQDLLDNVATVNGTISFQWISFWEIAQLYLPGYSIPGIIALLAIVAYFWERRFKIV